MGKKKKIREIRIVDETDRSVEVRAVFDYGALGSRRVAMRIPYKDPKLILRELKEAYKSKKPADAKIILPEEVDPEELD